MHIAVGRITKSFAGEKKQAKDILNYSNEGQRCMQRSWDKLNCNMREIITISDTQLQLEIYLQIVNMETHTVGAANDDKTIRNTRRTMPICQ